MTENRERISGCGCYQRKTLNGCAVRHVRRPTLIETSCTTDKRITKLTNLLCNCRESSTNRPYFLQNKANLPKIQMDVNLIITRDYEKKSNRILGENKTNQSQSPPARNWGLKVDGTASNYDMHPTSAKKVLTGIRCVLISSRYDLCVCDCLRGILCV
jgi:hypothetical protein